LRSVGCFDGSSQELLKGGGKFGNDFYSFVAEDFFVGELHDREFPILLPRLQIETYWIVNVRPFSKWNVSALQEASG
jgi:hypothetical protein